MRLNLGRMLCASTALATGLLFAQSALAQSTATQVQELVVTGARQAPNMNGLATQVQVAKDESVVSQQFISTQIGSQNFAQFINLLPGVSYSSEDPTGILSGDFRMHGLDCNHLSVTIDGSPVNDTGNYACFPGEYLVGELTDHVTVDIGATDVDSPTASAVGGQVNIISKTPPTNFGIIGSAALGSERYSREYVELDTGEIGPWGTRAYISGNYARADKYKGEGPILRRGFDARIYQPINGDKGFVSVAANWASNRPYFYESGSRAQLLQFGNGFDWNPVWVKPTVTPGVADAVPTPPTGAAAIAAGLPSNAGQQGNDTQYWSLHPNPVDFGQIRGASLYHITDSLTFTFDPSFFYTLANGGGSSAVRESDVRLCGNRLQISSTTGAVTCPGVDLNGDGDTLDTVAMYTPNNTKTHRWVVTSSLLWELNHNNNFQLAYTFDYGRHRQTGEATFINQQTGDPLNVFGAKEGYGPIVQTLDGSFLRGRDRASIAELQQVAFNYVGKFLDDNLHVNIGVRVPHFTRDLNQLCYTFNGTSVECTTIDPSIVQAAFNLAVAKGSTAAAAPGTPSLNSIMGSTITLQPGTTTPNFRFPFKQTFHFNKALPNAGLTYRVGENHLFYASYAQGFSAPKTDDLYTSSNELVHPETSNQYQVGYRYQAHELTGSINLYDTDYKNRIVQSFDPNDPTLSIDRNVGNVKIYGVDFEAGYRVMEHLTLYGSAAFTHSEIQNNLTIVVSGKTAVLPIQGKELVMTPKEEFSGRAQYDNGPIEFGLEAKYISSRWISDFNDDRIPGYADFSLDARYKIPQIGTNTYLQANVENLFDRFYISRSSTVNAAHAETVNLVAGGTATLSPGTPFLSVGAPRTFYVTLHTEF